MTPPRRLLEIRTYRLHAGSRPAFHSLLAEVSLPLVRAYGMDVVAFGPTPNDPDGYYLLRAFRDLEHLRAQQDGFYGSDTWRRGPREAVLACIRDSISVEVWMDEPALEALRDSHASPA